jgi:hypothetical protein
MAYIGIYAPHILWYGTQWYHHWYGGPPQELHALSKM